MYKLQVLNNISLGFHIFKHLLLGTRICNVTFISSSFNSYRMISLIFSILKVLSDKFLLSCSNGIIQITLLGHGDFLYSQSFKKPCYFKIQSAQKMNC